MSDSDYDMVFANDQKKSALRWSYRSSIFVVLAILLASCGQEKPIKETVMFIESSTKSYQIALPLSGVLKNSGELMPKAKLIRKLEWNGDNEGTKDEIFYSDDNGYFQLPELVVTTTMRGLEQFVANTELYIELADGSLELVWYNSTMRDSLSEEMGKDLDALECDISNSEVAMQDRLLNALTKCRWVGMPEFVEVE